MYHRSTAQVNKDHVLSEFMKEDSKLRLVFATVAFGMGVDVPDIEVVVHWGAPRGIEQYAQESGRAGRDGRDAVSIIFFSGYDLAPGRCTAEMKVFCKTQMCYRKFLKNYFTLDEKNVNHSSDITGCKCCSQCKVNCQCGNCKIYPGVADDTSDSGVANELSGIVPTPEADSQRNLNAKQLSLLKENLIDYRDCLQEELEMKHLSSTDLEMQTGLTNDLISTIVDCSCVLMCDEDVISTVGLWHHELAPGLN